MKKLFSNKYLRRPLQIFCLVCCATVAGLISCSKQDFGNNIAQPTTTVSGLEIATTDTVVLLQGKDSTLPFSITPDSASNSAVVWTSSDSSVVTVEGGKIHAAAVGSADISVASTDGTLKKASVVIKVVDHIDKVTSIEITNVGTDTSVYQGDTITLQTQVGPSNATYKAVRWISSDETIATVSSLGKVHAIEKGDVIISAVATDGSDIKASLNLHVIEVVAVESIKINTTISDPLGLSQTLKLDYTVQPVNATLNTLVWSSSDANVISVTQDGTITAMNEGTAVITVKSKFDDAITASIALTVEAGKLDDNFNGTTTPWITSTAAATAKIQNSQFVVTMALSGTKYRGDFQRKGGATVNAGKYPIIAFKMTRPTGAAGGANLTFDTNLGAFGNGANKFSTETAADGTTILYYNIATGTFGASNKLSTTSPTTLTTFQLKVADLVLTDKEVQAGNNVYHVDWVKSFSSLEAMEDYINK